MKNQPNPLLVQHRSRFSRPIPQLYGQTLLLLSKLLLLRHFFFQDIAWSRLFADAAAVCALLCLLELLTPYRRKGLFYWSFNGIMSLILFSSTLYFAHFNSVPTYTALLELHQVLQIKSSVQSTLNWSYYFYFTDFAVLAVWGTYRLLRRKPRQPAARPLRKSLVGLACFLCIGLCFRTILSGIPIDNELVSAEREGFLNYQVVSAIKAKQEASEASQGNLSDVVSQIQALQSSYPYRSDSSVASPSTNPASSSTIPSSDTASGSSASPSSEASASSAARLKASTAVPSHFGEAKGKNLIVLQLEAFQNFPLHLKVGGTELTPVLNKLADDGYYFNHVYQQIGQGNTSDAEFMSNTSIYPTGKIAMSTGYGNRALPSLPRLLQQQGYRAVTLHVNSVQFWDRDKLYPALNFDEYFDKPNFEDDHFNEFGASDEELYRVGLQKLEAISQNGQPFYAQFITASSHFPFKVPEDKQKITLPDNLIGTQLGDYLLAVNYTDYAIGTLIEGLKAKGLWDNTMLAVYGDHFGLQPDKTASSQVTETLGIPYDSRISRFNIPFIIHVPGTKTPLSVRQTGGQLDMMPTMANLLGVSLKDEGFTAFGHDLLNIDRNVLGSRYYLPTGSFFNNDILFVPGKGFDDGTAVSLDTLKPISDITPYRSDYDYVMKLMNLSDRYVRLLPKR